MNNLIAIYPYRHNGLWVFDDAAVGLVQEPFVCGADAVIDKLVAEIPNAENGFRLLFSAQEFPNYQTRLDWRREGDGGNWYFAPDFEMECWSCPALLKYFDSAPAEIFVLAQKVSR